MGSITSKQSSLRCPLNELFGSRGQVRLLRILTSESTHSLHPAEAAARAGMTESGARKALQRLARTGLVEKTGNGRKNRFVFCRDGALAREVARLFRAEKEWGNALAGAIRNTTLRLTTPPDLVWVQDFLAGWTDCQEVAVFYEEVPREDCLEALRERLVEVEKEFEIQLDLRIYSLRKMADVDWSRATVLLGTLPEASGEAATAEVPERGPRENPFAGSKRLNPMSSEFSGALAALLEENLSVLRRARENVRGRLGQSPNGHGHDLWEWQKILDTFSFPRLLHFLESDSPRAVRLRECSPFPAVLSEEEKNRLSELAAHPD